MTSTLKPNKWDRGALYAAIAFGAVAAAWTVVHAVLRIIEIAPNRDVPVTVSYTDTPMTLPVGPDGAQVPAVAKEAVIYVSDMPAITVASLIIAEIVYALAVAGTIACVCLVIRNLVAGRAFTKSTVALVGTATVAVALGWAFTSLFRTMGANGGASALSDKTVFNSLTPADPVILFAVASLGALAFAFTAGGRLQRETEGLV